MTDQRQIEICEISGITSPTPAEAHNTSDRATPSLIPAGYGDEDPQASYMETQPSTPPPQACNSKKRKLDASASPTSHTLSPAALITTWALYFFSATPSVQLAPTLTINKIGMWLRQQKINYLNIKRSFKGYQIIFPNQESYIAATKIKQIFQFTVNSSKPNWQIYTRGVIRVHPRETDEDLDIYAKEANTIQTQPQITSLRRIKSNRNGKTTPTPIVIINFKKTAKHPEAPKHITFGANHNLEVKPYIKQVKQCSNCLQYNHTANQCTFKKTKCKNCAQTDCPGICTPWCIHCKSIKHSSLSNQCPHRLSLTQQANRHIDINTAKIQTKKPTPQAYKPLLPTPPSNNNTHARKTVYPVSVWDQNQRDAYIANETNTPHIPQTHTLTLPASHPTITTSTPASKTQRTTTTTQPAPTQAITATRATTLPNLQATPEHPVNRETTETTQTLAPKPSMQPTTEQIDQTKDNLTEEDEYTSSEEINELTLSAPKTKSYRKKLTQNVASKNLNNLVLLLAYVLKQSNPEASSKAFFGVAHKLKLVTTSFDRFSSNLNNLLK